MAVPRPPAFERPKGSPLTARECRFSEGKVTLTPARTPAMLGGFSRFHFLFAFRSRLDALAIRNFFLGFLAALACWRLTFSILR
jgi:hypothetical protein